MHQPIKDNLEDYLKGSPFRVPQAFHAHLVACEDCASELRLLEIQANLLRSLRFGELDPRPGFYARVRERIEEQTRSSMWSVFLQPSFGRRLAIASAALVVLLGTYLVTTEPGGDVALAPSVVATDTVSEPASQQATVPDSLQQQRERNAVLVDLASYHE